MACQAVAALFVEAAGVYGGLAGVDCWDEARDARLYDGPHPVVAHPPCERWGDFWFGSPLAVSRGAPRKKLGDDGGCFAAALASVRRWGGVLEHPEGSRAWAAHGLAAPEAGAWSVADFEGGWTCQIDQSNYGHRARKPTWLYACGVDLPSLRWVRVTGPVPLLRAMSARRMSERGVTEAPAFISHGEAKATPHEFRDLLLSIARTALPNAEAA